MREHDPIKAQQELGRAVDFARDSGMPSGRQFHQNTKQDFSDGFESRANIKFKNAHITHDVATHDNSHIGPYTAMESEAAITDTQGRYETYISSQNDKVDVEASVGRKGATGHEFTDKNAEKAAALITSLAAKRLGERATQHADTLIQEVSAAREAYHRE